MFPFNFPPLCAGASADLPPCLHEFVPREAKYSLGLVGLKLDSQEGRARVCIRRKGKPILLGPEQNTTTKKTIQVAHITTP